MTTPGTPQQVIASGLTGNENHRNGWARDILTDLAEHGYAVVSRVEPGLPDWTEGQDGRSNSSVPFITLRAEVGRIIRDSAADLIAGRSDVVAGLILAQLAHRHGLAPTGAVEPKDSCDA